MRGSDGEVPLSEQVRTPHAVWRLFPRELPNPCESCHPLRAGSPVPQTFSQALASAKEQLARSLLS